MNEHETHEELPEPLQRTLRGLGGVRAPRELRDRVEMARMDAVQAPEELWQRVRPAVAEEAARRSTGGGAGASRPSADAAPAGRVLRFPARRAVAMAAGLALLVTAGLVLDARNPQGPAPDLAVALTEAERDAFLERILVRDVPVEDLSAGARNFAAMLGDGEEDDD